MTCHAFICITVMLTSSFQEVFKRPTCSFEFVAVIFSSRLSSESLIITFAVFSYVTFVTDFFVCVMLMCDGVGLSLFGFFSTVPTASSFKSTSGSKVPLTSSGALQF